MLIGTIELVKLLRRFLLASRMPLAAKQLDGSMAAGLATQRPHSFTFHHLTAAGVPMGLEQPLRQMVAPVAGARPPAAAFPGCAFFQSDVLLRALKVRLACRSCGTTWFMVAGFNKHVG